MPILEQIAKAKPQVVLFTGDNIYADTQDMEVMRAKYERLAADPGFRKLQAQATMLATWDDHDYGVNDGGREYLQRAAAQNAFLDFWGATADDPRRSRKGVYRRVEFGPAGKRLQVLLLDTRYFRSPLKRGPRRVGGPYYPTDDPAQTMLGEAQWKWLEEQLERPADLRLLVTSIQCLAESAGQETWSNLPKERDRLLRLLRSTNGVVMISGDRHWSEISQLDNGYPLLDITCSSFNQKHPRGTPTRNKTRAIPKTYHDVNYGWMEVDWNPDHPSLRVEIRDMAGEAQLQWSTPLSRLRPR